MAREPIKLFISHASEDKEAFVKGLADALIANGKFQIWYDDYSLRLGDSLSQSIARGLRSTDYGLVVLSPAFFAKKWPANELSALFALETQERKIILPIWHNVTVDDVVEFNPILADRKAIPSNKSLEEVVFAIEFAVGISARVKEFEKPFKPLVDEIRNSILERNANDQLSNSSEGVELVQRSVVSIFNQFERQIAEIKDLNIQVQRRHSPTVTRPYPGVIASGPSNANIEIGYLNLSANRTKNAKLVVSLFAWDFDFPSPEGRRKERSSLVFLPGFTGERKVRWIVDGDPARWTTQKVANQAVASFLYFIRERVQELDIPESYRPS
jgi:TIR domain